MSRTISLITKYTFALLLPLGTVLIRSMSWNYFITAAASILAIAILTNALCRVKTWIAYAFNTLALFLINAQYAILFWSNTFVTSVMIHTLIEKPAILFARSLKFSDVVQHYAQLGESK